MTALVAELRAALGDDVVLGPDEIALRARIGRTATVQAGCRLQSLQSAAERAGLLIPLDLGARARSRPPAGTRRPLCSDTSKK